MGVCRHCVHGDARDRGALSKLLTSVEARTERILMLHGVSRAFQRGLRYLPYYSRASRSRRCVFKNSLLTADFGANHADL